jgi:hypothetical protein
MYSIALGSEPGYELCGVIPTVNTAWAFSLERRTRGDWDVPVCRLSDRVIKIQFCLKGLGKAATNRAAESTFGLSVRYFFIPARPVGPAGVKSVIVGMEAIGLNLALTERAELIVTMQGEVEQSPSHPANVDDPSCVAVSSTVSVVE